MGKTAIEGAGRGDTLFKLDPDEVLVIGHDTRHKRGEHPLWQSRALEPADEAMAEHMAEHGFTSVVDVRRDGPNFEVIVGRRRVKAARRANQLRSKRGFGPIKIQVRVRKVTSNAELLGLMIAENSHRKDVEPIEMAGDLQAMLNFGATEEAAAKASCGGRLLVDLPREQQVEELGKVERGTTPPTVAAVRSAVKARKDGVATAVQAPGKRLLRQLLESERGEEVFGVAGVQALRFALGDLSPRQITGLAALIREVGK